MPRTSVNVGGTGRRSDNGASPLPRHQNFSRTLLKLILACPHCRGHHHTTPPLPMTVPPDAGRSSWTNLWVTPTHFEPIRNTCQFLGRSIGELLHVRMVSGLTQTGTIAKKGGSGLQRLTVFGNAGIPENSYVGSVRLVARRTMLSSSEVPAPTWRREVAFGRTPTSSHCQVCPPCQIGKVD